MLEPISLNIAPAPQASTKPSFTPPTTTTATSIPTIKPSTTTKPTSSNARTTQSSRVRVAVRVRPLLAREHGEHESTSANPSDNRIRVNASHDFTFDHAYTQGSTQSQIYTTAVSPLVNEVVSGYNVTIMAYGQTGSGKTFTMGTTGHDTNDDDDNNDTENEPNNESEQESSLLNDGPDVGITPRSIEELYSKLKLTGNNFEVSCSVLELYKDELRDLQRGGEEFCARGQSLRIQEVNGSIVVKNLVEIACRCPEDVMQCLRLSSCNRAVGSTEMNAESSRSHMVCRLTVQQFAPSKDNDSTASSGVANNSATTENEKIAPSSTSQLTFVDLAGSERLKKTMATGNRKKEGIAINKGLFHLGRVINANALGKNDPHIYRASKLTRLLQDALGGNSKTLFIA